MDLNYKLTGKTRHGFQSLESWQNYMRFIKCLSNLWTARGRFYPKFFDNYKINNNLNDKLYTWDLVNIHEIVAERIQQRLSEYESLFDTNKEIEFNNEQHT